jgi:hypothetical protein
MSNPSEVIEDDRIVDPSARDAAGIRPELSNALVDDSIKATPPLDRIPTAANHENPVLKAYNPGTDPDANVFPRDSGHDKDSVIRMADGHHDLEPGQTSSDTNRVENVQDIPNGVASVENIDGDHVGTPILNMPVKNAGAANDTEDLRESSLGPNSKSLSGDPRYLDSDKLREDDNNQTEEDASQVQHDAKVGGTIGIVGATLAGALVAGPVGAAVGAVASAAAAAAAIDSANRQSKETNDQ